MTAQTNKPKRLRARDSALLGSLANVVAEHIRKLPPKDFEALHQGAKDASETNCWWFVYSLSPAIAKMCKTIAESREAPVTLDLPAIRARAEAASAVLIPVTPQVMQDIPALLAEVERLTEQVEAFDRYTDELDAMLRRDMAKLITLEDEVERLSRNLEAASAECCDLSVYRQLVREEHPAEVAALTADVERLREAVDKACLAACHHCQNNLPVRDGWHYANAEMAAIRMGGTPCIVKDIRAALEAPRA